jgi:hypothetical protein
MPLEPDHISDFLEEDTDSKSRSELLDLLNKRIHKLCFEECQIDRIQCTLTPLCSRRFLLKLRLLNGLTIEDQPEFCYSVHKNIVLRDFRNKTVVYKPNDAYLYLIDFLDVFFHGDYRKLNKYFSKEEFPNITEIFNDRINNRDEDFEYYLSYHQNFMIIKYEEKLHIIFIKKKYALCNANRDSITDLELLYGLTRLFAKIYFPEVRIQRIPDDCIEITTNIPKDVLKNISNTPPVEEESKRDKYLWEVFPNDLDALCQYCKEVSLYMDKLGNLGIKISIGVQSNYPYDKRKLGFLRYRDLRLIFNIIYRLYNDFYIIWL